MLTGVFWHHCYSFIMDADENMCWYHQDLSRDDAEKILISEGVIDGSFLVRQSRSSTGDYVLSVLHQGQVNHYQIRKHGEDALFSITDEMTIHGLDTLIEFYQEEENSQNLDIKLTNPCKGISPPHDTRRHGRTNLLHRATLQKNYTIVSELLKCGYRSLDAKNELGQTAVHLAAKDGSDEILEKLIESKASVNCRDSAGYTPLHYACQNNHPRTVEMLMRAGGNVQARHTETGRVPLHEAAANGHENVIKVLLDFNVPLYPRTVNNETPLDLTQRYGHIKCEKILYNYKCPVSKENRSDWYHGTLGRQEAIDILHKNGDIDGSFLVRFSNRHNNGIHVLTVMFQQQPFNYQIQSEKDFLFIDDGPYLSSLEHLVEFYKSMPDGLPGPLSRPIPPVPRPPVPEMPSSIFTNTLRKKNLATVELWTEHTNVETGELSGSYGTTIDYTTFTRSNNCEKVGGDDQGFIRAENLTIGKALGEGEFGTVYEGVHMAPTGFQEPVAIKTLRDDFNIATRDEFLREARLMMSLDHHCIVRLIGISEGPPLLMVQELVPLGSMLGYLIQFKNTISHNYELMLWASQIVCGMRYLEGLRLVHRDIAARNILLATRHQAKISDFGLSRSFGSNDYYRATVGGKWPIKWFAPESYSYGNFTHASDVWSFGVTLWEMFSYGQQPYGDKRGIDVVKLVDQGERLSQPEGCPNDMYDLMLKCWSQNPCDRPTFKTLLEIFNRHLDYTNVKEMVQHLEMN